MQQPSFSYQQAREKYQTKIKYLQQRIVMISMARLAVFLVAAFAIYFLISGGDSYWIAILAIAVVLFVYLLKASTRLHSQKRLAAQLLFININELDILEGKPNKFDNGETADITSIYSADLDIFGEGSLYHFLNRTTTSQGSERLAQLLCDPHYNAHTITAWQEAVKKLADQTDLRHLVIASGLLKEKNEGSVEEITRWISDSSRMTNKRLINVIRFVLPLVNIAALLFYLDTDNPVPLGSGILLSWLIIGLNGKYIHRQHTMIGRKQHLLDQFADILSAFSKADAGKSQMINDLLRTATGGKHAIKQLSKLTNLFDQRLNLLVNVFLNSFFLYDIHCMLALERWKAENAERFAAWMQAVAEIETLISIAGFAFNHPGYTYPQVKEGTPFIKARNMSHPLIPDQEAVRNDFSIGDEGRLQLITGSNMSGKSTFLRTAGINLLLAQTGAPVAAESFSFSPMRILSSIRISDSLMEHTSYFMAELKRLQEIIGRLETGEPALVLIDEVLRGTNSHDKTHGSGELIRKLIGYNCITLFATHDLMLSKLEQTFPGIVQNYCFESRIEDGELLFDYTLRSGVATNKNASFLMQKMGIIPV